MNADAEVALPLPPGPREFRRPALKPFVGQKLTVAELCAECGMVYVDGRVHTPAVPVERIRHGDDERIRRMA